MRFPSSIDFVYMPFMLSCRALHYIEWFQLYSFKLYMPIYICIVYNLCIILCNRHEKPVVHLKQNLMSFVFYISLHIMSCNNSLLLST